MKKLLIVIALVIVVAIAAVILTLYSDSGLTVTVSAQEINTTLARKFPKKTEISMVAITFSDPVVSLEEGSDNLKLSITTSLAPAALNLVSLKGVTEMTGQVRYDPNKGAFFVKDCKVEAIKIANIPKEYLVFVEGGVEKIAKMLLDEFPLYELDPDKTKHSITMLLLKSATVKDGKLELTLSK